MESDHRGLNKAVGGHDATVAPTARATWPDHDRVDSLGRSAFSGGAGSAPAICSVLSRSVLPPNRPEPRQDTVIAVTTNRPGGARGRRLNLVIGGHDNPGIAHPPSCISRVSGDHLRPCQSRVDTRLPMSLSNLIRTGLRNAEGLAWALR
jgi:hypothetical protein